MKPFALAALAATCIAAALPAAAHEAIYTVSLSGAAEAPPNASAGVGFATITFDLDLVTMRVEATFSGLTGNVTASHIHCCTAVAGAGTAGVASVTPTFTGFPLGATFGTYDRTFDMTLATSYNAAFITNNGGTVSTALSAMVAGFDSGKAYLNVHSSAVPSGEIRGFLLPVPEVSTYAMMLAGLAAVGFAMRRRG
jgi:CHRD domain